MIDVDAIIFQLRKFAPIFVSVSGAADLDLVETITNLPMPAAYVVPLGLSASPNEEENALFQRVTATFSVVVAYDNSKNRIGLDTAKQSYGTVCDAVMKALLNWSAIPNALKGCQLVSSSLLKQDAARAYYDFTFSFEVIIDETDGYQLTGDDLSVSEQWSVDGTTLFREYP